MSELQLSDFVAFGVGIAGFTGVVTALGARSGRLSEYDRVRVLVLLLSALIPAFLDLLLVTLESFGIRGQDAYRIESAALMTALIASTSLGIIFARRMKPATRTRLSPAIWRIGLASISLIVVWNGLNLVGWPRPLSLGPVVAGMMWLLIFATIMFFRLLTVRPGDGEDVA